MQVGTVTIIVPRIAPAQVTLGRRIRFYGSLFGRVRICGDCGEPSAGRHVAQGSFL